ncbi:MAG: DUF6064 family protein [Actinomycetota bacterium]|nr:DUF6064 family protein [Actinomycetota bacterium]
MSTAEGLATIALGLAVGFGAGAVLRSRWAALLAPVAYIAAFELVRLDATGPTVDAIVVSDMYGAMAFAVGRGFHGLLMLLPMAVGVALGRRWAVVGRSSPPPSASRRHRVGAGLRRGLVAVGAALVVVLAVALLRPAATDPILDADGEPLAGSVAEVTTVDIGGHDQTLLVRGHSVDAPVVLFLAGGPGGSELGTMGRYARPLERDFVVVTWDQLGTGSSTGQFDPAETLSIDGAVADTIAVTEHLRDRFGVEQVHLVGNSYGTLLGVRAVQERPDLYAAFVGTGQMVDATETDQMFYEDALAHARATGDQAFVNELEAKGPPPYDDLLDMTAVVQSEREWNDYSDIDGFPGLREPTDSLFATEYPLMDQVHSVGALVDTYVTLYPELEDVDLRVDAPSLDVPVYLVQGAHEARGRAVLAEEWFDQLEAPDKAWFTFERSGHRPWVQEPERFAEVMVGTVLARTDPDAASAATGSDGVAPGTADEPADELLDLFADYNRAIFPMQLLAYAAGIVALAMAVRSPGRRTDQVVAAVLAAMWLWMGVVFFGVHAATLDPALSALYGAGFLLQALLLVRYGVVGRRLSFTPAASGPGDVGAGVPGDPGRVAWWLGWSAIGYALVVYPLIGLALGHGYPEAPLFGVAPCPTTIATFGLLLLARPPVPGRLLVVPAIWAVLAPLAAVGRGVPEDLALAAVGLAATVLLVRRDRRTARRSDAGPESTPAPG